MSRKYVRTMRFQTLYAATALALAAPFAYASPLSQPVAAERVLTGGLQSPGGFDRFIVKYRDGSPESRSQATLNRALEDAAWGTQAVLRASSSDPLALSHVRHMDLGAEVVRVSKRLDRAGALTLMQKLAENPNVEYVEVDRLNHHTLTPNDPSYSQQWGFNGATAGTRADLAWDITNGSGVVVAILDTGITTHADLNANVLPGYDFIIDTTVSNDGNGRDSNPADPGDWTTAGQCYTGSPASSSSWHGTHVAGTVAAVTNNSNGVAGMAWGAKIVPARVLGTCGGYDSDIADAMIWASGGSVSGVPANANPAEVINLSLGGSGACGATTQAAINTAVGNGSVVVIAAGNDNVNVSNASPANCNNVIAVASITSTGARSSFSNYGALIDIAAPGSTIYSTMNSGTTTPGSATYTNYSGTSMATPHVAGVVALMQAVSNPAKTPAQIESLLKSSARAFPSTPSQTIGAGMLDAQAAVLAAQGGGSDTTAPSTVSGLGASAASSSQVNLSWSAATDTGGSGLAGYKIERCTGSTCTTYAQIATTTSTSYANTGLTAGTTYRYRVRAYDGAGNNGGYSSVVNATTQTTGGTALTNGVAVTGLSAAVGAQLNYTMVVPAGATNLKFVTTGGTGDGDLYVKFGSAPTTSSYDCRSWATGNAETCNITTAQAGTYYVMVNAYTAFSGMSLTGSYTTSTADTTPPSTVAGLSATAASSTQVNLSWSAATDSGGSGLAGYKIERCTGSTCTSYAQIATTTSTSYSNTGLAASTTYRYRVRAYDGAGNNGSYSSVVNATTQAASTQTYTNNTDYNIPDNNTTGVTSTITVSGRTGNAPSNTQVAVNIVHPYIGDLIVDLLAPDGSVYTLHNRTGGSADNIVTTYTVNLSTEALNGSWRLRARDRAASDVGYINSWSITF
ncbi:MAG: S8 family serine peptidase [Xanthomonadales bacterium]|nr:S8 family serine peptidase [Xanthomonadales bacterium]